MNLGVAQLVARYLGVVEAAGSSPVTQTRNRKMINLPIFFILQGFSALSGADFLFFKTLKNERKNAKNRLGTRFCTRLQKVHFKKE